MLTLCLLIFSFFWFATINEIVQCTYLGVSRNNFQTCCFLLLRLFLPFKKSVYPGEMHLNAAFHQGIQCLSKLQFMGFQNTKG